MRPGPPRQVAVQRLRGRAQRPGLFPSLEWHPASSPKRRRRWQHRHDDAIRTSAWSPRARFPMRGTGRIPQEERSVKPSAKPTLVRTQHLPLPAEMARELGIPRLAGCCFWVCEVPLCPWESHCFQLCTDIWRTASAIMDPARWRIWGAWVRLGSAGRCGEPDCKLRAADRRPDARPQSWDVPREAADADGDPEWPVCNALSARQRADRRSGFGGHLVHQEDSQHQDPETGEDRYRVSAAWGERSGGVQRRCNKGSHTRADGRERQTRRPRPRSPGTGAVACSTVISVRTRPGLQRAQVRLAVADG